MGKTKLKDYLKAFNRNALMNVILIILSSFLTIMYNRHIFYVDGSTGLGAYAAYAFKYIPIILTTAFGGISCGMASVLIVFMYRSIIYSSFSYLAFIYLVVVCLVEFFARRQWFKRLYKTIAASAILQFVVGDLWGVAMLLLADRSPYDITLKQLVMFFVHEITGCLTACLLVYFGYKYLKDEFLYRFGNGKYYVNPELLNEDERYEVEGGSKIGKVVMQIIVFEAIVLGLSAEIASNTLIPTMKEIYEANVVYEETRKEPPENDISNVTNAEGLESIMSIAVIENELDSKAFADRIAKDGVKMVNTQFSMKLAMLISIIVIPLAVFFNRFAQKRIAEPIRNLSKAVTGIYNSNDQKINTSVNELHNLAISTSDEIEELYHAVDLTFYRLVEYIELVKSRQTIEDQLQSAQSANEAKSRFLSNISHEIRTPINAVLGFDEMILRQAKDEAVLGYARDIQSSGKTLLALINDILDFSKIEAGKMEIIPVEYDLSSVINDLVSMAEVRAKEKQLEFVVNVAPDIPHVLFGDEVRIKQCAMNLITNALKYTEKGTVTLDVDYEDVTSDVTVELDEEKVLLKVKVSDTGIGIKEEDIEKLSTAFERIDEKRNRTIEGTGLGINIVNSLLSMMNSQLEVESKYGEGSVFSFAVEQNVVDREPIGDFAETYKESAGKSSEYTASFHAPEAKILVVDDTRTNLTVIQGLLRQTQIQVDTAVSGAEALELVKQKKYDIVFLDHRMPGMDGIQTFHAMEELEGNLCKESPVIALTANAISGSREMYLTEGFTAYMSKPVDPVKLEELIMSYLPSYLVSRPGDADFIPDDEDGEKEREAMEKLLKISGVDVRAAIARCGSALVAIDVMNDFSLAINERADLIEKYERNEDYANYTIYVHGLKSSARAIGAIELSEKAKYLEECGNGHRIDEIKEQTAGLLELYRSYLTKLSPLSDEDPENDDRPEIDPEELQGAFESIKEFVSGSYFDSADDIMKMLEEYKIPEDYKGKYQEVKRLLALVDRDGLLNIL